MAVRQRDVNIRATAALELWILAKRVESGNVV
jgi:hypothetical protein